VLTSVLIDNRVPCDFLISDSVDNVIYCSKIEESLYDINNFTTKGGEFIHQFITEATGEKYVVASVTLPDGTILENVRFKVIVDNSVELPYSTIRYTTNQDIETVLLEAVTPKPEEIIESYNYDPILADDASSDIDTLDEIIVEKIDDKTYVEYAKLLEEKIDNDQKITEVSQTLFDTSEAYKKHTSTKLKEIYDQTAKAFFESEKIQLEEKINKLTDQLSDLAEENKKLTDEKRNFEDLIEESRQLTTNQITRATENANNYARRILELGGGGGSNAVQYANGGTMNGNLNVTGKYLSGGVDLASIFSGGGSGDPAVNSLVHSNSGWWNSSYTTLTANSATWITSSALSAYLPLSGGVLTGRLGVNNTPISDYFDLNASSIGNLYGGLGFGAAGDITISPNNNLILTQNIGNVGIGTSTPTEKLDVAGNITASGSASFASGTAQIHSDGTFWTNGVQLEPVYSYSPTLSDTNIIPVLGNNTASGNYSNVAGGCYNNASGYISNIGGGFSNNTTGNYSNIAGGEGNGVYCNYSNVAGGKGNTTSGYASNVAGGRSNILGTCEIFGSGILSNIAGGDNNKICGIISSILGGSNNNITNEASHTNIAGGKDNTASGAYSSIGGGYCNITSGNFSSIIGGCCNSTNGLSATFILGTSLTATQVDTTYVNNLSSLGDLAGSRIVINKQPTTFNNPVTASGAFLIININGVDKALQLWDFTS
jgi:hypothetical protein